MHNYNNFAQIYLKHNKCIYENQPFFKITINREINAFLENCFSKIMDTVKDKIEFEYSVSSLKANSFNAG